MEKQEPCFYKKKKKKKKEKKSQAKTRSSIRLAKKIWRCLIYCYSLAKVFSDKFLDYSER